MSLMNRPILIPPVDYSKVSDENWSKTFGRVNKFSDAAEDVNVPPRTYEQRLAEYMESHAEDKEAF